MITNWGTNQSIIDSKGKEKTKLYQRWRGLASLHYGFILLGITLNKSIN
jgi:hypothetical protein